MITYWVFVLSSTVGSKNVYHFYCCNSSTWSLLSTCLWNAWQAGLESVLFFIILKLLKQCLAHYRCSVKVIWMKAGINLHKNSLKYILLKGLLRVRKIMFKQWRLTCPRCSARWKQSWNSHWILLTPMFVFPLTMPSLSEPSDNSGSVRCLSNFSMHTSHLTISVKYRFWISRSGMVPEILHFSQAPRWCSCCWYSDHTLNSKDKDSPQSNFPIL